MVQFNNWVISKESWLLASWSEDNRYTLGVFSKKNELWQTKTLLERYKIFIWKFSLSNNTCTIVTPVTEGKGLLQSEWELGTKFTRTHSLALYLNNMSTKLQIIFYNYCPPYLAACIAAFLISASVSLSTFNSIVNASQLSINKSRRDLFLLRFTFVSGNIL